MNIEDQEVNQFDSLFMSIAEHHPQGPAQLLDTFVGFLSRKTDFFVGTIRGNWENLVLNTFRKYEKISLDAEKARRKHRERVVHNAAADTAKTARFAKITELTEDEAEKLQQEIDAKKNAAEIVPVTEDCVVKPTQENAIGIHKPSVVKTEKATNKERNFDQADECDKLEEGKLMPNKGNGYDFEKYCLTQTLSEIEIAVPLNVAFRVRKKDVVVKISKKHLIVGLKNQTPIIDGKFEHDIKLEASTWFIEDGKTILLSLDKGNNKHWWSKIVVSDPEISVKKINPDLTKLCDEDLHGRVENVV